MALIGSEPVAVTASSVATERADVLAEDSMVVTTTYADGSLATIQYLAEGHRLLAKERCEVFADGRCAVIDDFRSTRFYGGGRGLRGKQDKGFDGELRRFLGVCRDGGPWPIPWQEIVAVHRVCFAARRSLGSGETVTLEVPA
jgi:predicted dehydrogenase